MARIRAGLSAEPLDVAACLTEASDPACGGLGVFVGTVRGSAAVEANSARPVVRLEYDAHESLARTKLEEIAREAAQKWGLGSVVAVHRTGNCGLGDPTVIVACAAPHRAEALEACRHMIDTIKETVPVFKKEVYADGSAWVGVEGAKPNP